MSRALVNNKQYQAASVQAELSRLLSDKAEIYLPGTEQFDYSNARFSEYGRPTYIAAVHPASEQDVANTVRYSHMRGIGCTARSGGHCVTNYMKKLQDGIVVDMRFVNHLTYDAEKELVTAGGGVYSGDFAKFIHDRKRELGIGSCPTTGLIGVALGGGIGRLQGKYGYLSDNMVSCRLVLADGSIITVSETEHKDLFWAMRGAGHNFGIVYEATFKVYPQPHGGIHHSWDFEFGLDKVRPLYALMNRLVPDMHPNLACFLIWSKKAASGAEGVIILNAVWSGPKDEAKEYISQFEAVGPVVPATLKSVEWSELPWVAYQGLNQQYLGNPDTWNIYPYKIFSAVSAKRFDLDALEQLYAEVKELERKHDTRILVMFEAFSHKRSKEIPDNATAFPWRHGSDIFLLLQVSLKNLDREAASNEWLNRWKKKLIDVSGYGRLQQYSNYGHGTNINDPIEAMYGYDEWRLRKLRGLKRQYDPDNWFRWYQPFWPDEGAVKDSRL
ncbi:hypothetical protein SLS58_009505 [Diplodia intermedia]|uniref:FAD-binding PCMH-type domain-containing protein n=1 Tax=Diplodia intermedia TaxID=856260 RepID=A0ABR3TBN3_9PEZI